MDVADWLRELGLEQYIQAFQENAVDGAILIDLTADDLKDLGVNLVGHRRKILTAVQSLRSEDGPEPTEVTNGSVAERRQLTVMFCDVIGFTELSSRLDPEDLSAVVRAYQERVATTIARFGGFIARYVGDGVLIYFGWPKAYEANAERAVRSGLAVVEAIGQAPVRTEQLRVRLGIATGLVVVGEPIGRGDARQQTAIGETPNLAARLQGIAQPNGIVIDAVTRRQIGDLFEFSDLGAVELKGIAGLVPAWQVLGPSTVESRYEALRGAALTSLVGRDEEIELLRRRWTRAKGGDGQVVLISGEPGIGKSRIAAALTEHLQHEPHRRLRYFCSPYHQDSALFPFVDQLGRAAGFEKGDTPLARLEKLEALLAPAHPLEDDVALLADLLSLPATERHPLPNLSSQGKRDRTVSALIRQLEGLARQQPVLIVFEDSHWIDPTSRELLDLAIESVRSLPVLLIVTFRPEFQQPWAGQPQVTALTLNRLDRRDRFILIRQIASGKVVPDEVLGQIADRADGVPLFLEELTKNVLESGLLREEEDRYVMDRTLPQFAIPTTLHDSLMARLDRLSSVRQVAQIGAAIGREFPYSMLNALSQFPENELRESLARLVASDLIFQRGTPPDATYVFKHALVQEAVHSSLLKSSRQQLHAQIAEALAAHSPDLVDSQPEVFAQHYTEAGRVYESVVCWGKAGQRSATRSAMAEAATQFQKGLNQLALLPDTAERQRQELELRSAMGAALSTAKGYAALETGEAYARARQLWEQLGSPPEFLRVPFGQSTYHWYRGEFDLALQLDEHLLALSHQHDDVHGLVLGHRSCGRNLFHIGRFGPSRSHLEEALALFDPDTHRSFPYQVGFSPFPPAAAYLGLVLFCLGYPDQALQQSSAAIAFARRQDHPPLLAGTLVTGIRLQILVGDKTVLAELVEQLVAVTTKQGFPQWKAVERIFSGWIKVKNGDIAEGISLLRVSSASRGIGAWVPHNIALLAAACAIAGETEEALALLDNALQATEGTGERWLAAELNRCKGQLLLRQGHADAAEDHYRRALSIAQEQRAKLWELRAALSLACLRRSQGRRAEARDLLAAVYAWFNEGFATPDLREAKALLSELT